QLRELKIVHCVFYLRADALLQAAHLVQVATLGNQRGAEVSCRRAVADREPHLQAYAIGGKTEAAKLREGIAKAAIGDQGAGAVKNNAAQAVAGVAGGKIEVRPQIVDGELGICVIDGELLVLRVDLRSILERVDQRFLQVHNL